MTSLPSSSRNCGLIMPISECDGMSVDHWSEVREIIEDSLSSTNFDVRLVSDTIDSNLIHKEILHNIYNDDIIVVDVSGRNPNVFFELGIRMATQLPVVIVKDDETPYPFDTGPVRYVEYRRDLRYPSIETFKSQLLQEVLSAIDQDKASSFIGQIGPFKVPNVESISVGTDQIVIDRLETIETTMRSLISRTRHSSTIEGASIRPRKLHDGRYEFCARNVNRTIIDLTISKVMTNEEFNLNDHPKISARSFDHFHFSFSGKSASSSELRDQTISTFETLCDTIN